MTRGWDIDAGPTLGMVATTDEVLSYPGVGPHLLNASERRRMACLRQENSRRDFLAAHILVRLCVGRFLDIPPDRVAFGQRCPSCQSYDHGKPMVMDGSATHLSLSHTDGVVAAAVGAGRVGIDVERRGRRHGLDVLRHVLTPDERRLVIEDADASNAFLRMWVRKEGFIKVGRTNFDQLGELDLSGLPTRSHDGALKFEDLFVLDLEDDSRDVLGALVSAHPASLVGLVESGSDALSVKGLGSR